MMNITHPITPFPGDALAFRNFQKTGGISFIPTTHSSRKTLSITFPTLEEIYYEMNLPKNLILASRYINERSRSCQRLLWAF